LKRAIQKEVETQLGRLILKGEVRDGQSLVIDFDAYQDALQFATVDEAVPVE
jgi:ATP-dependent Clp protease ATP-binding subunit ClpB